MATGKIPGGHAGVTPSWQPPPPDFNGMGKQLTQALMPDDLDATLDRFFADEADAGRLSRIQQERELLIASYGAGSTRVSAFDDAILSSATQAAASAAVGTL